MRATPLRDELRDRLDELCRRVGPGKAAEQLLIDPHTLRKARRGGACDERIHGRIEQSLGAGVVEPDDRGLAASQPGLRSGSLTWGVALELTEFDYVADAPRGLPSESFDDRRDYLGMLNLIRRRLPEAGEPSPLAASALAHLNMSLANQLTYGEGDPADERAADAAAAAVRAARSSEQPVLLLAASMQYAAALYAAGRTAEAALAYDRAADTASDLRPSRTGKVLHAHILYERSRCLVPARLLSQGLEDLERSLELARDTGDVHSVSSAMRYWGVALLRKGVYDRACQLLQEAEQLLRAEPFPSASSLASCRKYLAIALTCDGSRVAGERMLEEATRIAAEHQFGYQLARLQSLQSRFTVTGLRRWYQKM